MKEAARAAPTVTVRLTVFEPEPLEAVKVTVSAPAVAKAWLGFWAELVDPSPKFQLHEVGLPVDVSVNWTAWLTTGEAGL